MAKGDFQKNSEAIGNTASSGMQNQNQTPDYRSQGANQQQSPWANNRQSQYHNFQRYNYSGQPSYQWGQNMPQTAQGATSQASNGGYGTGGQWWNPPNVNPSQIGGGKGGQSSGSGGNGMSAGAGSGAAGSNSMKMQELSKQAVAKGLSGQQAVDWVNQQAPGAAQFTNAGQHWDPNKLVWYDKGGGYGKFQYAGDDGNWEYKSEGGQPWYVNNLGGGTAAYGTGPSGGKNG